MSINRKPIDISTWDAAQRSVRYRMTRDSTVFGILCGDTISPDGRSRLFAFDPTRTMPWSPPNPTYGVGVGQYQFIHPIPEVQALLDLINGVSTAALAQEPDTDDADTDESTVDPLANKPIGNSRQTAVKNSRLR